MKSINKTKIVSQPWTPFIFFIVIVPSITTVFGFTALGSAPRFQQHQFQETVFRRGKALFASSNATLIGKSLSSSGWEQLPQQRQRRDPVEEQLLQLSLVADDEVRRQRFEKLITASIGREQRHSSSWIRQKSPFVQQVQEQLKCLGTAVQQESWDNYVTLGFQAPSTIKSQLWACLDMTVQFQVLVRKLDPELNP